MSVYWNTLNTNGITKERLLSYDRAIHHEPSFRRDQKESLLRDLGSYLRTLKVFFFLFCFLFIFLFYFPNILQTFKFFFCSQAVHSGADLESAISNCMGYKSEVTPAFCFKSVIKISNLKFLLIFFKNSGTRFYGRGEYQPCFRSAIWISGNFHLFGEIFFELHDFCITYNVSNRNCFNLF